MKSSKLRPLPWLPAHSTRIRIQTRNPITIPASAALRAIRDPTSTLKQVLTAFSSAARRHDLRLDYDTYQTLISLLSRHRRFRLANVVLSLMRRRDALDPGPTVLIPLAEAYFTDGRPADAADLFLRFSASNKFFSFLVRTLVADAQLDVAESLFSKAADLGFQIQVRYYNALVNGLCDHLRIDDGVRVFKGMLQYGVSPDVITFSTLMSHLGQEGRVLWSNALLGKMLVMGISPDMTCFKILFRMYLRNQMVGDAVGVLRTMACERIMGEGEVLGLDCEVGEGTLGAVLKRGSIGYLVG